MASRQIRSVNRVVLQLVGRQQHGFVDDERVDVAQRVCRIIAISGGIGMRTTLQWRPERRGEIQQVLDVRFDLSGRAHLLRVLADEQGRFVQQLHVHVNVVDAVRAGW